MRLTTFAGTNKQQDGAEKNTKRPSFLSAGDTLKPSGASLTVPSLGVPSLAVPSRKAEDTFQKREASPQAASPKEEIGMVILTDTDDKNHVLSVDNQEHLAPGRNWNDIESRMIQEEKERVKEHKSTGKLASPEDDKGDEENREKMNLKA